MNKKLILILTEPRTGSTFLNEALNLYSVYPTGEIFQDHTLFEGQEDPEFHFNTLLQNNLSVKLFDFLKVEQGNFVEFIKQMNLNPINFLLKLYEISPSSVVVKLHKFQAESFQIDKILDLPFVEIIILERSNRLARYTSLMIAMEMNKWAGIDTSDKQVVIDRERFIQTEEESKNWFNVIKHQCSLKNYLEINYERDLENFNVEHFYKLFDTWFKKINLIVIKTDYEVRRFEKQNRSPLQYSIINYKELEDFI